MKGNEIPLLNLPIHQTVLLSPMSPPECVLSLGTVVHVVLTPFLLPLASLVHGMGY